MASQSLDNTAAASGDRPVLLCNRGSAPSDSSNSMHSPTWSGPLLDSVARCSALRPTASVAFRYSTRCMHNSHGCCDFWLVLSNALTLGQVQIACITATIYETLRQAQIDDTNYVIIMLTFALACFKIPLQCIAHCSGLTCTGCWIADRHCKQNMAWLHA